MGLNVLLFLVCFMVIDVTLVKSKRHEHNFASERVGAYVSQTSPGSMKVGEILNEDRDTYMMIPKNHEFKWLVIGLSEEIRVKRIDIANFEFFSLHVKDFAVYGTTKDPQFCYSSSHLNCEDPRDGWEMLGLFRMEKNRDVQTFKVTKQIMVRYLRIDILSTYGEEHYYITLSVLRVFGSTVLEDVRDAIISGDIDEETSSNSEEIENSNKENLTDDKLLSSDPKNSTSKTSNIKKSKNKNKKNSKKKRSSKKRYLFPTKRNFHKHRICLDIDRERFFKKTELENDSNNTQPQRSYTDDYNNNNNFFDDDDVDDDEDDKDNEEMTDEETSEEVQNQEVQKGNILTTIMQKLSTLSESHDTLERVHIDFEAQSESLHIFLSEKILDVTKTNKEQVKILERIEENISLFSRSAESERKKFREEIIYFIFYSIIIFVVIQIGGFCFLFTQRMDVNSQSQSSNNNNNINDENFEEFILTKIRKKGLERKAYSMREKRWDHAHVGNQQNLNNTRKMRHFRSKSRDDGNERIFSGESSFANHDDQQEGEEDQTKDDFGMKRSSTFHSFRNYLDD